MKYKVGDKVRIKSLDWYNTNKNSYGVVEVPKNFISEMSEYCSKDAIIVRVYDDHYCINIDNSGYVWTDEMFEDMEVHKIVIPEGWEIDKVKNGEIILKEAKKELPKTWEECLEALGYDINNTGYIIKRNKTFEGIKNSFIPDDLVKPILTLIQLLVCREVYRQGWEPDWSDSNKGKYVIHHDCSTSTVYSISKLLSFQSVEVRDKFLENFRDLIEEAKELI